MTAQTHHDRHSERAYVVRRPRVTDAIGESLQRTFGISPALPHEMQRLIGQLDRIG